jgi:tetratricopeptide (TPR) repeat protein
MYSSRFEAEPPAELAYELFAQGTRLLRDGHPHQAAVVLRRAKRLEPEKGSIREALGRALFMSGLATHARREFAKAVQIDPANDYAHFALAPGLRADGRSGARDRASEARARDAPGDRRIRAGPGAPGRLMPPTPPTASRSTWMGCSTVARSPCRPRRQRWRSCAGRALDPSS